MYATYIEYCAYCVQRGAAELSREAFMSVCGRAERFLKNITNGKITVADESVKQCVYIMAEEIAASADENISSESVGSYSRSFRQPEKSLEARLYAIASEYLSASGLLYMGV